MNGWINKSVSVFYWPGRGLTFILTASQLLGNRRLCDRGGLEPWSVVASVTVPDVPTLRILTTLVSTVITELLSNMYWSDGVPTLHTGHDGTGWTSLLASYRTLDYWCC